MGIKAVLSLAVVYIMVIDCHGQIKSPQLPSFATMQPVYQTSKVPPYSQSDNSPAQDIRRHPTAQDVIMQQNQQSMILHTTVQKQQDLREMMGDVQEIKEWSGISNSQRQFAPNPERTRDFPKALDHLEKMLTGKLPLSVADAYFTIENAFGDCYLTRQQFDNITTESATFIRTWMQQNGLDAKDRYQVHFAIKKFMSETLSISKGKTKGDKSESVQTTTHSPFRYDYNDYQGEQDYRNLFVTKCFATGFGQCASMPGVYLVLAEKLGVKAYLSLAPYHSFIKHPDNFGYIVNYEPTSNWEISDNWYKDNMFISAEAVRSGIYLDTLNSRQVVANCIFDLAVEYIRVDRTGNEDFILSCLKAGARYFPRNNNLPSLFVYSMHLKTMLREVMRKHNINSIEELQSLPKAKAYYKEYLGNEAYITRLGYQNMPAGLYEEMLQHQEFKGKVQSELRVTGKEKRDLFEKIGH